MELYFFSLLPKIYFLLLFQGLCGTRTIHPVQEFETRGSPLDSELGLGESTRSRGTTMNRIPVYEVINQRPVEQEPGQLASYAVFRPLTGDECTVTLSDLRFSVTGACPCSTVFGNGDQAEISQALVVLGEADCAVDRALEAVLSGMVTGGIQEFCLGDGQGGSVSGRVRLAAVRKRSSSIGWQGDDQFKLADAARHKDVGNRLYLQGRYADAFHRFNRSIRAVLFVRDVDAVRRSWDALYAAVCNNMAACQLHLTNYEHARQLSDKALAVDPDNVKALIRRCRASAKLRMFDSALADASLALCRDPGNAVAEHYRQVAARGIQHQDGVYKDMVKKMFAA